MRGIRVQASGTQVLFEMRDWDGIDRPSYTEIERMSPESAEHLIGTIQGAVQTARDAKRAVDEKRVELLRQEIGTRQAELNMLEAKLFTVEAA